MCRKTEYEQFLANLQNCAVKEHEASYEYELSKQRQDHFDEMLETNLTVDQKAMVEEILFQFLSDCEHEVDLMYRQGIKDGVWMLKTLGVLS